MVIGAAAGMPRPGWPSSGYLVHTAAGSILLDCGPGTAAQAAATPDLIAVAITHLHLDHCLDVVVLGKALAHAERPAVPLLVPAGGERVLREVNRLFPLAPAGPGPQPTDDVLSSAFRPVIYQPGEPVTVGPVRLTPLALQHRQPCCGFRVEFDTPDGLRRLAYTGDTGDTDAIVTLAADTHLLVCEATLTRPDTTGHGHLTATQAGRRATQAGVQRLVLTHFPTSDERWLADQRAAAAAAFAGPVGLARPGSHHLI